MHTSVNSFDGEYPIAPPSCWERWRNRPVEPESRPEPEIQDEFDSDDIADVQDIPTASFPLTFPMLSNITGEIL